MAGLYIHIPFCKQACHYCNFHFSTNQTRIPLVLDCIALEIIDKKHFFGNDSIETIYFGGGSPSLLDKAQLAHIIRCIQSNYNISDQLEITLEVNPDDVTPQIVNDWLEIGINRISLGIQSLHDDDLSFMNRAHSSADCMHSLNLLLEHNAFELSVDLIFGFEGLTTEKLQFNIEQLASMNIQHMSCYAMTIEAKTVFNHRLQKGELKEMNDHLVGDQFKLVHNELSQRGFEHYEISNYCIEDKYAKHNTSYWKGRKYLGIGPSAHSFDGEKRYWNVSNNTAYISNMQNKISVTEEELLSDVDQYNEYLLTGLRTKWGVSTVKLKQFGADVFKHFLQEASDYLASGRLIIQDETVTIHQDFWPISDRICSDLFLVN